MRKKSPDSTGHLARRTHSTGATPSGNLPENRSPSPERVDFRALLDDVNIGVAQIDPTGTLLYSNPRFREILGINALEQIAGSNLKNFVFSGNWNSLRAALAQAVSGSVEGEITAPTPQSEKPRTIRLNFAPRTSNGKTTIRITAIEVTGLVETTKALRKSEASVQHLSANLLRVQDEERRRMARELHDTTGQELAVALMSLNRLEKNLTAPGDGVREAVSQCVEWLRNVESEIRTLSYVLYPPLLDEMGLRSALPWFIEGFSKRTGIKVQAEIPEDLPRLELETETALFRVIQEALTNVYRHSGSRMGMVRLSTNESSLQASVSDKGCGFDCQKLSSSQNLGVGIQSMRGRLELVGGKLDIRSNSAGTQIIATVPLEMPARIAELQSSPAVPATPPTPPSSAGASSHTRKRILIADDHEVARRGIRALLKECPDLEICGEAVDGLEAVEKTFELKPDLVILDLSMPRLGGFSAAHQIMKSGLSTKILIYTTHSYPELERTARAVGFDGYVLKSNASHDLIRGVEAVLQGQKFYTASVA